MSFIYPVYQPSLTGNEKKYVNECLDSTWISSKGSFVNRFEREFSEYVGVPHAVSVSNGTTALHLALLALGLGPDDEVIVPTLTYVASVNAITYVGATPVFVDSECETWQINVDDVRAKVNSRTRAILVVHLYGYPCDMHEIMSIAQENNLYVVEDCAEALGTEYDGQHVGTYGHISTFSFFGNKTITTGEGGMVVTADAELRDRCVHLRGQGLAENREYWHDIVGYNYRMTNICAAIGVAQLEQIRGFLQRKAEIAEIYRAKLEPEGFTMPTEGAGVKNSYWIVNVLVENSGRRDIIREKLKVEGVETRPVFYLVSAMPMYCTLTTEEFKVAADISSRGISLPSWPGLSNEDVENICDILVNSNRALQ